MIKRLACRVFAFVLALSSLLQLTACGLGPTAQSALGEANDLTTQAGESISSWSVQIWDSTASWVKQAWDDSSEWISTIWKNSTEWTSIKWDSFTLWISVIASGNPFAWIQDEVLSADYGMLAYDSFVEMRTFFASDPDISTLQSKYNDLLSEFSLPKEDIVALWTLLQEKSDADSLSIQKTAKLVLPFLNRLLIEGESVVDENTVLSGPVIGQYLLMSLDALGLDSDATADRRLRILDKELQKITRPVYIGDYGQSILVTEDGYYIENYTCCSGKYQIFMIAANHSDISTNPSIFGKTLEEQAFFYFPDLKSVYSIDLSLPISDSIQCIGFRTMIGDCIVEGHVAAIWGNQIDYLFFVMTDQEWRESEFNAWLESINCSEPYSVSLDVDFESDGSFFGIDQFSQKYTINRLFDEEKTFLVPKTGHGWAAERGNNLIDNLKGVFQGRHSTVVGDNNVANGPDRVTLSANGSKQFVQTKYYSSAARGIASCFKDGTFRYYDADHKPMAIEVPADKYEASLEYFKNRILNGEVDGVTDPEHAVDIIKKAA